MLAASVLLSVVLATDPVVVNDEVHQRVNQYLISESAGERNSLLRELQKVKLSEVEAALRTGTTALAQPQSDTLVKRTWKTDVGEQEFETLIYIPRDYSPAKRYRVLVALHGTGGNGANYIHSWLSWIQKRDDVILAAPTIIGEPWGGSQTAHSHVHTLIRHLRGSSPSTTTVSLSMGCRWEGTRRSALAVSVPTASRDWFAEFMVRSSSLPEDNRPAKTIPTSSPGSWKT